LLFTDNRTWSGVYLRPLNETLYGEAGFGYYKYGTQLYSTLLAETITDTAAYSRGQLIVSKTLPDVLTETDAFTRLTRLSKIYTEAITDSDSLSRLYEPHRTVSEALTSLDNLTQRTFRQRSVSESLMATDTFSEKMSIIRALSEILTDSDSTSRLVRFLRSLTESVTGADSKQMADALRLPDLLMLTEIVIKSGRFSFTPTEILTLIDSFSYETSGRKTRDNSDIINILDNLARTIKVSKTISDGITLADTFAESTRFSRAMSEEMISTESINRRLFYSRALSEALTDGDTRWKGFGMTDTDNVTITGSLSRLANFLRIPIETLTLSETFDKAKSGAQTKDLNEFLTATDTFSYIINARRFLSDSLVATDNITPITSRRRTLSESLSGADVKNMADAKIFPVDMILSEVFLRSSRLSQIYSDTFTLGDGYDGVKLGAPHYTTSVAEILTLGDTVSRQFRGIRVLPESISLPDSRSFALKRVLSDSTAMLDSRTGYAGFNRVLADTLFKTDIIANQRQYTRGVQEYLTFADSYARSAQLHRTVSESASLLDTKSSSINMVRYISESIISSDQISKGLCYERILADSLVATDIWLRGMIRFNYLLGDGLTFSEFIQGTFPKSKRGRIFFKFDTHHLITYDFEKPLSTDLKYSRIGTAVITHRRRI
jgi:hypothetical protein